MDTDSWACRRRVKTTPLALQGATAAQLSKQRGAAGRCVGFHNGVTPIEAPVCKEAEEIIPYIIICSKCSCQESSAARGEHRRYGTSDGELHGTRGEAKGVPRYALVSALVSHTQVLNGERPVLADVELATLCDLDALLLHQQKTETVRPWKASHQPRFQPAQQTQGWM